MRRVTFIALVCYYWKRSLEETLWITVDLLMRSIFSNLTLFHAVSYSLISLKCPIVGKSGGVVEDNGGNKKS